MNLNVITTADAVKSVDAVKKDKAAAETIANPSATTASGAAPEVTADDLYGRLLKYIPAPLIGIYLFVINLIISQADTAKHSTKVLLWVAFAFFALGTVAYLITRKVSRPLQISVSVLAFTAFAAASPGPFQYISGWDALYGTLALAAAATILIIFKPNPLAVEQ